MKKNNNTKKCKHKWVLAWMELRGKTFAETRNGYICSKCKEEKTEKMD